jgi:phosphotransferase system enzyme I (PtsI)
LLAERGVESALGVKVGAMIEVPSAALMADAIAKRVDFFSIGTNDLVQYTLAADRANKAVSHLYQPANIAVLKLIKMSIDAAKRAGIRVGVCGESASDPVLGVLWAALGVDSLSMSASFIRPIANIFNSLTRIDLDEYAAVINFEDTSASAAENYVKCKKWLLEKVPEAATIIR